MGQKLLVTNVMFCLQFEYYMYPTFKLQNYLDSSGNWVIFTTDCERLWSVNSTNHAQTNQVLA